MTKENDPKTAPVKHKDYPVDKLAELTRAIAESRAVIYLGAGASASAGLPSWNQLLKILRDAARPFMQEREQANEDQDHFEELFSKGKSLEAGDWLHHLLDTELKHILWSEFSEKVRDAQIKASPIHGNIVRMPFSLALTTNYDCLLQTAYAASIGSPTSVTWADTRSILEAIRSNGFMVVHAHGMVGNGPTLIITGRHYRDLMHTQPRFGEMLRLLLMTKTFLFVGSSLEDPDLVYHLHEVIGAYGPEYGLHYALMPYAEVPPLRRKIIEDNLRVRVIPIVPVSGEELLQEKKQDARWMTTAAARVLRNLSGAVAELRLNSSVPSFPTSDDPQFYSIGALHTMLGEAVKLTGSFRGDICLSNDLMGSHLSSNLEYRIHWGPTDPKFKDPGLQVQANSICGIAYYRSTSNDGVYLSDVSHRRIDQKKYNLGEQYGEVNYVAGHTDVMSELAVPIEADGVRVGVLNLESTLVDAYSEGHESVARWFADKAGRLLATAHERQRRGARIDGKVISGAYREFLDLFKTLWRVAESAVADSEPQILEEVNPALLVYQANHETGFLMAQDPKGTILPKSAEAERPRFPYYKDDEGKDSLAVKVFTRRKPLHFTDVEAAMENNILTSKYKELFSLRGPMIGFPVMIHGHIAGVAILWEANGGIRLDGRHIEIFRRAAHLVANLSRQLLEVLPEPEQAKAKSTEVTVATFKAIGLAKSIPEMAKLPFSDEVATDEGLNDMGKEFRNQIGTAIFRFLEELRGQEQRFSEGRRSSREWISAKRCRCWVRTNSNNGSDDCPVFVLALQVSLNEDLAADQSGESVRFGNLLRVDGKKRAIGMKPFPRQVDGSENDAAAQEQAQRKKEKAHRMANKPHTSMKASIGSNKNFDVEVYFDNPHLSFLLSRISAYRFSFMQRPGVLGPDVMADVLHKNPSLPWFVVPLMVPDANEWKADVQPPDSTEEDNPPLQRRLVGYLTFDNGYYPREEEDISGNGSAPQKPEGERDFELERPEEWISFQNSLLDEMDLFGAALVTNPCLSGLTPAKAPSKDMKAI